MFKSKRHEVEEGRGAAPGGSARRTKRGRTVHAGHGWRSVTVKVPEAYQGKVPMLMAMLETLVISPDVPTRVVINERTGTVVLGGDVTLSPVAIAHGGLTVEVNEGARRYRSRVPFRMVRPPWSRSPISK